MEDCEGNQYGNDVAGNGKRAKGKWIEECEELFIIDDKLHDDLCFGENVKPGVSLCAVLIPSMKYND
jgi:hypothetical protein